MAGKKRSISRVTASSQEIKQAYGTLSRFYAVAEGIFEKGLRKRGLKLLAVKPGEVVLEIGFGTGYSLKEIASSVGENGKAHGIDITPQMIKTAANRLKRAGLRERVTLTEGDARKMPYPDDKFDAVYIADTLELFDTPDIPKVLREIKRVLKESGRLVVTSLSRQGKEGSLFVRFYEWLHRTWPKYINCRPIYVAEAIKDAGYEITRTESFSMAGLVPYELVLAKPKRGGNG